MALISIEQIAPDVTMGLWAIDESESFKDLPLYGQIVSSCKSRSRQMERLASLALLREMTGDSALTIGHTATGKPVVEGWSISVSHTRGLVAIILSKQRPVAVDVEYTSDRVKRVAKRFMRADEQADGISALLLHWCMKETIYKYFSEQDLTSDEIRVHAFPLLSEGKAEVDNLRVGIVQEVHYRVTPSYVLTYLYGK